MKRVVPVIAVGLAAAGLVGLVLNLLAPPHFSSGRAGQIAHLLAPCALAVVAAFLAHRRPDHRAGHLLTVAATGLVLDSLAKAVLNLRIGAPTTVLQRMAATVDNTSWVLTYWAVVMLVVVFPDGRLLSQRWRWVPILTAAAASSSLVIGLTAAHDSAYGTAGGAYRNVSTMWAAPRVHDALAGRLGDGWPLFAVCILLALCMLFVRSRLARRRRDATTVAQIRWLAWSMTSLLVITVPAGVVASLSGDDTVHAVVGVLTELVPFLPVTAIVVAVTRHGLFDIDRVVSRTVAYTVVVALLAGVYVGVVLGLTTFVPADLGQFGVAVATLVVAASAAPLTRRVRRLVDRRFNRARVDSERVVASFAADLRERPADTDVPAELVTAVRRSVQPTHASVWLVPTAQVRS